MAKIPGRRWKPSTPWLVIASAVLVAALGGGAYASGLLGPCGYAVCRAQLGTGSVDARNVRARALQREDFSSAAIASLTAQPRYSGVTQGTKTVTIPATSAALGVAPCPSGTVALGGGGQVAAKAPDGNAWIVETFPSNADGTEAGLIGWGVEFYNSGTSSVSGQIYVTCGPA